MCLPMYLSVCLPMYLPVHLSVDLSVCLPMYLSVCLPMYLPGDLSWYRPGNLARINFIYFYLTFSSDHKLFDTNFVLIDLFMKTDFRNRVNPSGKSASTSTSATLPTAPAASNQSPLKVRIEVTHYFMRH